MTEHRQGNRSRRHFGTGRNALLDERHGQPAAGKDTAAKSTTTPNEDVQMSAAGRPSAFLEGSMHDRASAVPPTRFTADEALLERYIQDGQPPEGVQAAPLMKALPDPPRGASTDEPKHPDASAKVDKDGQRRSGIFRFGKSIASAFSTASIKKKHDGEGSRGAKAYSVEEHRHRVEKIYAEMKKDGRLPAPTVTTRVRRTEAGASVTQHKDPAVRPVDQTEKALPRESREQACQDQTVKNNNDDDDDDDDDDDKGLPRQPASEDQPIASPGAESTASHRNPFHFRRPSVPNLKKVKSGIHRITSESLVSLGTVPPVPPVPAVPGDDTDSAEPDRTLRTQKSRKDLHRQQKLSKRVSNLEGKLLSARRELDEAMGQAQRPALRPLPANTLTMRAFVGGTLPSLPSERFLLADKLDEHDKGRGSFDEKVFRVDAAAADMESAMTTTTTTTATSPLRIMSVGEGVDRSSTRESNTTPGKRKSGGNHMERYQTDEARDQSPAHHPLSSPSKKRRVEAAPRLPADDDELAQNNHNVEQNNNMEQKNNIERSLPRSESISSTLALTNEVALFESALEPRPAVIQSIAEESMAVDTPSSPSPHSSSTLLFPQSAPLTGPAMGLFPPRHATDPSLSSSTRRKGSKIPRRSISPPPPLPHLPHSHPPSLPPPHPCSAVTRQLRSRASMPRLESSSSSSNSSSNSSTNFRSEAGSLVPPLQPTKRVLPRSPALHMAVGPPCERGREGVVVLGVASSLGWNRRGIDLAVSGDCSGYGNGSVNGSVKGYGYGNDTGDGNSYAHAHGYANRNANGNETGNRTTNGTANGSTDETEAGNATARGNAAGHEHGDTNTGDLHDRLVACAKLDGGIDAVGIGSGATAGAGAGASAALGAAAGVGANASVGAGDDGFEWPDDVF